MPNLGDFLGQLVSEISIARMHADIEAARIAEIYASHPMLKHFPIPRFRMPDVSMEVAVAIDKMQEVQASKPARGGVDFNTLRPRFNAVLLQASAQHKIPITEEHTAAIDSAVERRIKEAESTGRTAPDLVRLSNDLADDVIRITKPAASAHPKAAATATGQETAHLPFRKQIADDTVKELVQLRSEPPRLAVFVTGKELREFGGNVTKLNLKITESGIEWSDLTSGGESTPRLVPE